VTEKKTKGKKAKAAEVAEGFAEANQAFVDDIGVSDLPDEIDTSDPNLVIKGFQEIIGVAPPGKGPDYHVTDAGDILLDTGAPIPEDHHVHPAHRALAATRKARV